MLKLNPMSDVMSAEFHQYDISNSADIILNPMSALMSEEFHQYDIRNSDDII